MIGRRLFLLAVFSNCVLSLPVTSSQLENDDVQMMKCIVEALADVLSRPHLVPISEECLVTLKTDDRLLAILRHHNFLKELQEIAVQGALQQRDSDAPTPTTKAPHATEDAADRSMLDALGGPGERSILSQRKRTENGRGEKDERREDGESQEDSEAEEVEEKGNDDDSEEEGEEEEYDKKRAGEKSEEGIEVKNKREEAGEKGAPSKNKSTKRTFVIKDDKRSALLSQKHGGKVQQKEEEEDDKKTGGKENLELWTKRAKALQLKKKAVRKEEQQEFNSQQEVPHHSKEVTEETDEKEKKKIKALRSPEEKELQMIAHGSPEEKRGEEEEGSGSRKPEEPEIESLATIESELENVAQKLHELRRG